MRNGNMTKLENTQGRVIRSVFNNQHTKLVLHQEDGEQTKQEG